MSSTEADEAWDRDSIVSQEVDFLYCSQAFIDTYFLSVCIASHKNKSQSGLIRCGVVYCSLFMAHGMVS